MVEAFYPKTLEEALRLKALYPGAGLYAGGTDWMVRKPVVKALIFLNHLSELQEVEEDAINLYIGAACTYTQLLGHEQVPKLLKKVMNQIASPAIRNRGTLGGNICNASPAGDSLPLLYALGAQLLICRLTQRGEKPFVSRRMIPIQAFIKGVRQIDLKPQEILTQIIIPKQTFEYSYYEKVGARQAEAISKLSFVGLLALEEGKISAFRIAFGAVGPTVVSLKDLEQDYIGMGAERLDLGKIKQKVEALLHPIDDGRSTASYRKQVALNLLEDFLRQAKGMVGTCYS